MSETLASLLLRMQAHTAITRRLAAETRARIDESRALLKELDRLEAAAWQGPPRRKSK